MSKTTDELHGVQGWLLLLCVSLTVLTPLFWFRDLVSIVGEILRAPGPVPSFINSQRDKYVMIALVVVNTAFTFISVNVGMALWRVRPGAVQAARKWLGVLALVKIPLLIIPLVPQVATLDPNPSFIVSSLCLLTGLQGLVSLAWRDYLASSRRVAATYGG